MRRVVFALLMAFSLGIAFPHAVSAEDDSGLVDLVSLLAEVDDTDFQLDLLKGIHDGLAGRKSVPMPAGWGKVYEKLSASPKAEVREKAKLIALVFGDEAALNELRNVMLDPKADVAQRAAALEALVARRAENLAPHLHELLADISLRGPALRGLAACPHEATPQAVLHCYEKCSHEHKQDAIGTLASRVDFAHALLDAVEGGKIPAKDITAYTARQIQNLPDEKVKERLIKVWGEVREQSGDKRTLIGRYKELLTPDYVAGGDPRHGRMVFEKTCQQCHKLYGEGGEIGPDLTGSNRSNLDYVLDNVVTPSAAIAKDYQLKLIVTVEGRLLSGIVKETRDNALVIQTANEKVTVSSDDIEELRDSPISMMPEGLWDKLSEHEIRDLVRYLASQEQAALPETRR